MQVKEVMSPGVIGVQENMDLFEAVGTMLDAHVSAIFAFNADGALVGIVSEGDLLHRTELGSAQRRSRFLDFLLSGGNAARDFSHANGRTVSDVMTRFIVSVDEEADISHAIDLMTERHFKRLPVVRGNDVVGVISRSDILRALHKASDPQSQRTVVHRTDAEIGAAIEAAIADKPWASAGDVQVHVEAGVVTLEGSIGDERVRRALAIIAENMPGVVSVRDQIAWIEPNSGIVLPNENERAD